MSTTCLRIHTRRRRRWRCRIRVTWLSIYYHSCLTQATRYGAIYRYRRIIVCVFEITVISLFPLRAHRLIRVTFHTFLRSYVKFTIWTIMILLTSYVWLQWVTYTYCTIKACKRWLANAWIWAASLIYVTITIVQTRQWTARVVNCQNEILSFFKLNIYKIKEKLQFWQIDPLYKNGHWHCGYPFTRMHFPPFKQFKLHWFIAFNGENIVTT